MNIQLMRNWIKRQEKLKEKEGKNVTDKKVNKSDGDSKETS